MHVIIIGKQKFTGPSAWEQITPRHYLQLLNWRIKLGGDPAGRYALLQLWFGIRYRTWRLLSDDQRVELVSLLDFLDTRPERWLLPKLRVNTRRYIGPGDGLDHLTFGEFMHAQAARDRYRESGNLHHLAELMASLYRPKAYVWQPMGDANRRLFDTRKLESQTARMALLPVSVHQGILFNYEGCLDRFPDQFEYLFPKRNSGNGEGGTWLDVGLNLARQTSALGTFRELENTNLFLVLTMLDSLMKENEALKKKYERG